jgi:hypothetical protein
LLEDAEDIGPMGDSRALVSKKSDTGLKLQERVIKPAFNFDDEDMSSGSDESFVPSDEVEEEPMIVG